MPSVQDPTRLQSNAHGELLRASALAIYPLAHAPVNDVIEHQPAHLSRWCGKFLGECWRRMMDMHTAFEQSESSDGARSRERSRERVLDEEAWVTTKENWHHI